MQGQILNYLQTMRHHGLPSKFRQMLPENRKLLSAVMAIVVILSTAFAAFIPNVTRASETNVLQNGSFEHPFVHVDGCGAVGSGWNCFTNGGAANYAFQDDEWELVVADGDHSQMIGINTLNMAAADSDRYAGISQTVRVMKNSKYRFSMSGMIRTSNLDSEDDYRYVVQVGWADGPNAHWKDVDHWADAGFYSFSGLTEPRGFQRFSTSLLPQSEAITIFVRLWRKWGEANQEVLLNVDNIALMGMSPQMVNSHGNTRVVGGVSPQAIIVDPQPPMQPHPPTYPGGKSGVCEPSELLFNGDFESGFLSTGYGAVGSGWGAFTNGGAANFGFYDEQWEAVISGRTKSTSSSCMNVRAINVDCGSYYSCANKDDECSGHGQLIEINTKDKFPTDPDRYAGIYQQIGGLIPGETYTFSLRGLLRGTGDEADKYRFSAQWGFTDGFDTNWRNVEEWEEMDLGPIYPRTEPGPLGSHKVTFRAPSSQIVVFIRAWNKWAIPGVELDFNLDDISLVGCRSVSAGNACGGSPNASCGGPVGGAPGNTGPGGSAAHCTYVVVAGDSLGAIANRYGVSSSDIAKANNISNPNLIYVGQQLRIPGCGNANANPQPVVRPVQPAMQQQPMVQPGIAPSPAERPVNPGFRGASSVPIAVSTERATAVAAAPIAARSYTVRSGQSLGQIALENGVDPYTLAMANNIRNMDLLYVGQVLQIP